MSHQCIDRIFLWLSSMSFIFILIFSFYSWIVFLISFIYLCVFSCNLWSLLRCLFWISLSSYLHISISLESLIEIYSVH
jgi:hypothetical protein